MIKRWSVRRDDSIFRVGVVSQHVDLRYRQASFPGILKGLSLDAHAATTAWRAYFGLEIDPISESFVVLLNPEGTRLLRSWRHVEQCPQCGGNQTAELSLEELKGAALA